MIEMTSQAEKPNDCHDFGQKIEFFFIFGFWAKMILKKCLWIFYLEKNRL